ncbi:MAG: hypothetical protein MOIL_00627 [Candidatus Methanolliviera sp. GoM_oil]|nr:MAG: hypothetical protein MOIL_00627 [Candidatus Methanolliviera sp. GoM_oil]
MYEWLEKEEEREVMGDWMRNLVQEKAWVRDDLSFRDKRQKIRTRDVFMRWYAPNENNIMKSVYWLAKILDATVVRKKSSETFQAAITHLVGWLLEKTASFNVVVTREELFVFIDSVPGDFWNYSQ